MKQLTLLFTLTVLFFSFQSKADFMLNPYLGYESGTVSEKPKVGADSTIKDTAFDLGAHIGYRNMGFWIGADITYALAGTSTPDTGSSSKYTRLEYGPAIGFHFMSGIGIYGTYLISVTDTITPSTGPDNKLTGTSGYKAGISFHVAPRVSLGAEYYSWSPTKSNTGGADVDLTNSFSSITETGFRVVLGFHFM